MKRTIIAIGLALVLSGCTDSPAAFKVLDDLGFSSVELTGYRWFLCGNDYTFHTGFRAKNPNGKIVTGAVCSGFFKGSSIKFD